MSRDVPLNSTRSSFGLPREVSKRDPRDGRATRSERSHHCQNPNSRTPFIALSVLEYRQARPGRSACPCTPKPSLVGVTAGDVATEPAPVQTPTVRLCPMGLKVACSPAGGRDRGSSLRASGQALTGAALPWTINAQREAGPRRYLGSWRRRGRQPQWPGTSSLASSSPAFRSTRRWISR